MAKQTSPASRKSYLALYMRVASRRFSLAARGLHDLFTTVRYVAFTTVRYVAFTTVRYVAFTTVRHD